MPEIADAQTTAPTHLTGLAGYNEKRRLEKEAKQAPVRNLPIAPIARMPNEKDANRPIVPIESSLTGIYDGTAAVFVSKHAGLSFTMEQIERLPSGIESVTRVPVRFKVGAGGGRFGADNEGVAELMRRHPCFGGSAANNFTDRADERYEPMFWEGGFPDWFLQSEKAEQDDIKYNAGENEVGDPLHK